MSAARRIAFASSTDVPPNFITSIAALHQKQNPPQRHRDTEKRKANGKRQKAKIFAQTFVLRLLNCALLCASVPLWWVFSSSQIALCFEDLGVKQGCAG